MESLPFSSFRVSLIKIFNKNQDLEDLHSSVYVHGYRLEKHRYISRDSEYGHGEASLTSYQ